MGEKLKIINGNIITPEKIIEKASLVISDGIITEISDQEISSAADIIIDAEAKYNIEIDNDSAEKIINVGTCIDVIIEKLNQNK